MFDRSGNALKEGEELEQADGTAWMAMYALDMLRIAMEIAVEDAAFEDGAITFFEHFVHIAEAINEKEGLWNEDKGFYFDRVRKADGSTEVSLLHPRRACVLTPDPHARARARPSRCTATWDSSRSWP